ncbi:metal ABC transporter solute-binding protein, Zn/Mn family [Litchfieldella xinjiangensis]|uniref:metal ABC transporter solute-binding protein, Zn/Mn family n=1 Tax=Litchfieldella xinjiangensis TaxID=1166948 RepID=UPI0005BCF532|nr:zinc ABC transporter substrate-binding protein [Halomonas xinjiangensis]
MPALPLRTALLGSLATLALSPALSQAQTDPHVDVVASFSILADMVENVGGEYVSVTTLVGPDSDAHVFSPSPTHARTLSEADLVVFNGLQFEGWMERLVESSGYSGPHVVTTDGLDTLAYAGHDHDHAHGHDETHDSHGHEEHDHDDHAHAHGDRDPHAWQNLSLAQGYVTNIRDGLIEADPDNAETYRDNAERYLEELKETDRAIREQLSEIAENASVVTGHDSFGYFSQAYGIRFLSPAGLSTEVEPSAADMARLIDVIREQSVQALFHENMTNPNTLEQIAEETGLPIAGTLYADALASEGEASTYLGMMRHNTRVLHDALGDSARGHDHDHDHDHSEHAH